MKQNFIPHKHRLHRTTFSPSPFNLPFEGSSISGGHIQSESSWTTGPIRLLLVEDNPGDAYLIQRLLSKSLFENVEVLHANCLENALKLIHNNFPPNIVLLDLNLPDSNGESTYIKLREVTSAPVVILTGLTDREIARNLLEQGAYGFVRKDEITETVLFNSIYCICRQYGIEQDLILEKEKAESASREKTSFLGSMSHELRTPLTAILGFGDLLLESENLSPKDRQLLSRISVNGRHLLQLVNDLLDLSKIEKGFVDISRQEIDLPSLLDATFSTQEIRAREKKLTLSAHSTGEIPATIVSDRTRLTQILNNILGNAIKFTNRGCVTASISLSSKYGGGTKLVIRVKDDGMGIPSHRIPELFKPYGKVREGTTYIEGSGLGLVVSKNLANLLGGDVELVESSPAGSTFEISVDPSFKEEAPTVSYRWPNIETASTVNRSKENSKILEGIRILIIEDSQDLVSLYCAIFEDENAITRSATLGSEGIEIAMNEEFDVIILDMTLPDMHGKEVAKSLRASGITTPIIALTAHALADSKSLALEAGCTDYVTKPVNFDALKNLLHCAAMENKKPI